MSTYTLTEFMRPYRALPGGHHFIQPDATSTNADAAASSSPTTLITQNNNVVNGRPVISTAHPPRDVLACIALCVMDELNRVHSANRVIGHLSEHDVLYTPTTDDADAKHAFPESRLGQDRCELRSPLTARLVQFCDDWKWSLTKSVRECTPAEQAPSHYCTTTVPLFHSVRPQDVESLFGGSAYYRVYNILNDYESLVYMLVNMFASHHDRMRLQGLQRAVGYTPQSPHTRMLWFWKLSMAYYPPWAKAMLRVIDHERECVLREPVPLVASWTHRHLLQQLQTIVLDMPTPSYGDCWYPIRNCVNQDQVPSRMPRHLIPIPGTSPGACNSAWTHSHGRRRTQSGSAFYDVVRARIHAWIPEIADITNSVSMYHQSFMALEGDATSTVVPRQLLRGAIGSHRTHVDHLFAEIKRIETEDNQRPPAYLRRIGTQAIRYAKAMFHVLTHLVQEARGATTTGTSTSKDDTKHDKQEESTHPRAMTRLSLVSAQELALLIAYSEEVMQVLIDNVDCAENICDAHPEIHECVTQCDLALHQLVLAVLEHHGESMLREACELMSTGAFQAHASRQLLMTSDQYARLFVMARMRIPSRTPHLSMTEEAQCAASMIQHIANQLRERLNEQVVRHVHDRHKTQLDYEQVSRRAAQAVIEDASNISQAPRVEMTRYNRDMLP